MEITKATILLKRIDAACNMARFYHLSIETDLFGAIVAVRRWGRIGTTGRQFMQQYTSVPEAVTAVERQAGIKRRRGYADV